MTTTGLLLAAGGGRRMGRPKALVEGWLVRSVEALAGCDRVVVVLGAGAEEARRLLDAHDVTLVVNPEWESGMGSSLEVGLGALLHGEDSRCLITLVDLPDVGGEVVGRLLSQPDTEVVLARATYAGRPGHPVLLGRSHWALIATRVSGDEGARSYLEEHGAAAVECGDLATGEDVDSFTRTRDVPS